MKKIKNLLSSLKRDKRKKENLEHFHKHLKAFDQKKFYFFK